MDEIQRLINENSSGYLQKQGPQRNARPLTSPVADPTSPRGPPPPYSYIAGNVYNTQYELPPPTVRPTANVNQQYGSIPGQSGVQNSMNRPTYAGGRRDDLLFIGIRRRDYENAIETQRSRVQKQKRLFICKCVSLAIFLPAIIGLIIWSATSSGNGDDDCGSGCYMEDNGDCYCP